MSERICVITAGHLATSPRMLKAADALAEARYHVRVVSASSTDWAAAADVEARRSREGRWDWTAVDHRRAHARSRWLLTGARMRLARSLARLLGSAWLPGRRAPDPAGRRLDSVRPARVPLAAATRALGRAHPELVAAALAAPADLFYGGTTGGLAAVAAAGRRAGAPYALDLEDFHGAEAGDSPASRLAQALVERVEGAALPGAAFVTASSAGIASAYLDTYGAARVAGGRPPIPIHNVFRLPARPPSLAPRAGSDLHLYWFSQTIGAGRGLEDAVQAMGMAGIPGVLHLRGRAIAPYLRSLERLAARVAPGLAIVHHEPAPPDRMVELCAPYDAGLSLEQPSVPNRDLCLTNKAFTYMLAGLPVVFTATSGQEPLAQALEEGALVYAPGDVAALARGLRRWADDRALLGRARRASWEAARRRWHWEHPLERGALLEAVAQTLSGRGSGRARREIHADRDHR
jgi:hypothetical protein